MTENALAEAWAKVPINLEAPPAPKRRAAPEPTARAPQTAGSAASPPAATPTVVRTSTVPAPSMKPSDVSAAQIVQAPPSPDQSAMTTLRAIALTFAGLLAVGTAVRMVL